jgi:hypothetical protein
MNNHTHAQYTSIFTWKPNAGENHKCFFLYVFKNYIHWKHQLPFSPVATGRRLRPPIFSGYNLRESPTPQFSWLQPEGGYNPLCSLGTTTYPFHVLFP